MFHSSLKIINRRQAVGAALGLLVLAASTANAAELAQAVEAAYQRHPDRALAASERNLADALDTRASQLIAGDPAFNLKYQTDSFNDDRGFREWEGGVELPMWTPRQRSSLQQEANSTLQTSAAMTAAKYLEIAGEVRDRLWQVALARTERDQAQAALASAQELERDIRRRVEAGELARQDLLLAQREITERNDAYQRALNALQQARYLYTEYTGLDDIQPASSETPAQNIEITPAHPRLALANARLEQAQAYRNRVSSERHAGSSVWIGGRNTRATAGAATESAVGIELSIPLGSRSQYGPQQMAAEQTLVIAQANRDRTLIELREQLHQAVLAHELAQNSLQRAEQRKDLADESLRMSQRAFELGETDFIRLMKARADAITAQHDLEIRRRELGRSVARLNQALGVIPQ